MSAWRPLDDELARWAEAGRKPSFWWRDDDAAESVPALDRLMTLAARLGAPIGIAVVPARASAECAKRILAWPGAVILQHGFAHENHAVTGESKNEFPETRPLASRIGDIRAGRERLTALAGARSLPVFVPPWNRLSADTVGALHGAGLRGLSRNKARREREAAPGVAEANIHVDPIDWQNGRRFVGEAAAVRAVVAHLSAKRADEVDPDEPTGLLTHHLVQDEATWDFVEALIARIGPHIVAPTAIFAAS